MFFKIGVIKNFANFTGKHLRWSLFLNKLQACLQLFKKETPAQVFSCEICEIFKDIFCYRTPTVAVSERRVLVTCKSLLVKMFLSLLTFTCSKLTTETLEEGVKYGLKVNNKNTKTTSLTLFEVMLTKKTQIYS